MPDRRTIISPIYTAEVNNKAVRFFKAPGDDPALPWHALDDLFVACGFNRQMRSHFMRNARKTFGDELHTVATDTGLVTIAPHYEAQALLRAVVQIRSAMRHVKDAYEQAAGDALTALSGDLPPIAQVEFMLAAARNSGIGGEA